MGRHKIRLALSFCALVSAGLVFAGGSFAVTGPAETWADLGGFGACLFGPEIPVPSECRPNDLDLDDDVDLADFAEFQVTEITPGLTEMQLAGNALVSYPFFEFVTAFNANAAVRIGVDPTRNPELLGVEMDLYVVADKSEAEWDVDPGLVDVRTGGPQAVMFGGSSIQENTIQIAAANELSADAGAGLGVGYDVVIDADRDGVLDEGDYIDGYRGGGGFYVIADTTLAGPYATTAIQYTGGTFLGQRTYYPTSIAQLGQLPLVVISHGNGHQYTWYDYLQQHLASYGYVVLSHENDTQPGIESASTTTLTNTDYFLGHLSTIGGGVLNGHVDTHRIIWVGHSRGGEGVVRAYDRICDGYNPAHFTRDDIILVSSIAPTDFLGRNDTDPHEVDYHLIYGSADGDVSGGPDSDVRDSFDIFERARGFRQSTYVHGADHNDFNCCGFDDFEGPIGTAIGRPAAQRIAKAAYLALVKHYVEGNIPAKDLLWRQYENIRPIGVATNITVDLEYKEGAGSLFVDDFQSNPALNLSSSGGVVTYDVQNPHEGLMNDTDGSFQWYTSDPMNGMSRARPDDTTRGLVFEWTTTAARFLEFALANLDASGHEYLSFRACQQTRHPQTTAELGDLTFSVTLLDALGGQSQINIGAYGGGLEEPYQRTGYGTGAGWQNEFEVIRIRLSDFLRNGATLDLTNLAFVRFDFGSGFGSTRGRVAVDDLQFSKDSNPGSLIVRVLNPPAYIPPGAPVTVQVTIRGRSEEYVPDTGFMHYRYDGGPFVTVPLVASGVDTYEATLPAVFCGDVPEFYVTAQGTLSGLVTDPPGAPTAVYTAEVGDWIDFYEETLDVNPGWTISGGQWAFGVPHGQGGQYGGPDPTSGHTGTNVYGYNLWGDYANSMPEYHLTTAAINCSGRTGVRLSFWRWLGVEQSAYDHARLRVSTNGSTWTTIWENSGEVADLSWSFQEFDISAIANNQATVYIRWTMGPTDGSWQYCGWNIDDVRLSTFECIEE